MMTIDIVDKDKIYIRGTNGSVDIVITEHRDPTAMNPYNTSFTVDYRDTKVTVKADR